MRLPNELLEAARSNNLVIWVGAGLSWDFNNEDDKQVKGWGNLAEHITDSFPDEKYLTSMLMKSVRYIYEPIQILDILEVLSTLPKSEIANYVKYFYSLSEFEHKWLQENMKKQILSKEDVKKLLKKFYTLSEKQKDWSLHESLCKLSNFIITTNYDNAFELTCKRINRPLKIVLINKNIESQKLDNGQRITLIKLHGSICDEDTMVIFPYDYAYLYEHRAHSLISELKKLILTKSMLFIGCGMGDWQINNIFKFAKENLADLGQKHFIIETENNFKDLKQKDKKNVLDFLTHVPIVKYNPDEKSASDERNINNIIKTLIEEKNHITKFQIESDFYSQANEIFNKAILLKDENLLEKCCELYKKAAQSLNSRNADVFYNWGIALFKLAELRKSENLYLESINKLNISAELNPYEIEKIHIYRVKAQNRLEQLDIENVLNKK